MVAFLAMITLAIGPMVTLAPVAAAGAQGGLRVSDAALVRDGGRWLSIASGESATATGAKPCTPGPAVFHIPYRVGPQPDQLGDCWAGDLLPGGPGTWADGAAGSVGSPTLAKIGDGWWLFYTARKSGSQQRCIGGGVSNAATGPGWFQGAQPVVCPASGSAVDPELFYDRKNSQWLLLWRQDDDAQGCQTSIQVRRLDPQSGLVGSTHQLLASTNAALGFDDIGGATGCPGGVRQVIENPSMVRGDDDHLRLFFSANDRNSRNYATGWSLCGTGSPMDGTCALLSAFDPLGKYRPAWGAADRTAPVSGVNAKPYSAFPDVSGFGGLSLAVPDPTASGNQPVYATAQMYWGGASQLPTQFVLRVDNSWVAPALYETDTVTWHGKPSTFGTQLPGSPTTPSGQSLSTRGVNGFAWPTGHNGIFNTVTADGTIFVAGNAYGTNAWGMGAYDPRTSEWQNIEILTSTGKKEIHTLSGGLGGGGPATDIKAFGDGNQVAFTNISSLPTVPTRPEDGVWPVFGVITKKDGKWQVAGQWTGAQLRTSTPPAVPGEPSESEKACPLESPPTHGVASWCLGPNELSVLPRSKDIVVAQYGGGLMVLRMTGPDSAGKYGVKVRAYYDYPPVQDIHPQPGYPGEVAIMPKAAMPDPTSTAGDERFVVTFDMIHPDDHNPNTSEIFTVEGGIQEFSYDSSDASGVGKIKPVSAPVLIGPGSSTPVGLHTGLYDHQGNLWATAAKLVVYAKTNGQRKLGGPECPFNEAEWKANPNRPEYTTTVGGTTFWGQTCRPDYDLLQRNDFSYSNIYFPAFSQLAEDPTTKTMVSLDTGNSGDVLAFRHTGTGRDKTFTMGNLVDTGRDLIPLGGHRLEQRPPSFDKAGRMWIAPMQWAHTGQTSAMDHWLASLTVDRLFDPAPVVLPTTANQTGTVQAENNNTFTTSQPLDPPATIPVDSDAYVRLCSAAECVNDGIPGGGYVLDGRQTSPVEYKVYVPAAGSYRLRYHVQTDMTTTGAKITFTANGTSQTTTVHTPDGKWAVKDAATTISLPAGLQTIRLAAPAGGTGWLLNWFSLTRN